MNARGQHKCAYSECECVVGDNEQYCSDYCSDADDANETEVQCDCQHTGCAPDRVEPLPARATVRMNGRSMRAVG